MRPTERDRVMGAAQYIANYANALKRAAEADDDEALKSNAALYWTNAIKKQAQVIRNVQTKLRREE